MLRGPTVYTLITTVPPNSRPWIWLSESQFSYSMFIQITKCRMGFWDNIKNMANHCFNAIKIVANAGVSKIKSLANDYGSKTEGLAKACFNKISNAFGIEPDGVFESLTGQRVSVALDILLICFRLKSWLEMGWYLLFWLLSCF